MSGLVEPAIAAKTFTRAKCFLLLTRRHLVQERNLRKTGSLDQLK
jgi:hypothetical protein